MPLVVEEPEPVLAPPSPPTVVVAAAQVHSAQVASSGTEQWRSLVQEIFPIEGVDTALRIMGCESGGNPHSHNYNPSTRDDSVGLMQINIHQDLLPARAAKLRELGYDVYDRESAVAALKIPEANLQMALWISSGGYSFGPWSCK